MRNIWILGLVSLLTDISSEMIYPLLPLFLANRLGATPALIGIIEGLAESTASLMKFWSGRFSDRLARRKPLTICGYGLAAVAKFLLFMANSWVWVMTARFLDRLGKGVRTAPRDALISESAPAEKQGRAFGLHRLMDNAGAAIGILLGYYLFLSSRENYQQVFLLSLLPAVIGVLLLLALQEKKPQPATMTTGSAQLTGPKIPDREEKPEKIQVYSGINKALPFSWWRELNSTLKWFLILSFLFTLGNSSNQFLLLRAQDTGFAPAQVLLLYFAFNVAATLFSYPAGRFSDRYGRFSLLITGYLVYATVYTGFALADRTGQQLVWLLFVLYGLYSGCTEGVEKALLADLAPAHLKATVLGLHAMIVGLGLFPASFLAGILWTTIGPAATFTLGALSGLIAATGLIILSRLSRYRPLPE